MKIHSGWASEFARYRFDVDIEEQDFSLLMQGAGVPAERAAEVTLEEKFQLMYLEGELLALAAKHRYYENEARVNGREPERDPIVSQTAADLAAVRSGKSAALKALKVRLGVDDDSPADS